MLVGDDDYLAPGRPVNCGIAATSRGSPNNSSIVASDSARVGSRRIGSRWCFFIRSPDFVGWADMAGRFGAAGIISEVRAGAAGGPATRGTVSRVSAMTLFSPVESSRGVILRDSTEVCAESRQKASTI